MKLVGSDVNKYGDVFKKEYVFFAPKIYIYINILVMLLKHYILEMSFC